MEREAKYTSNSTIDVAENRAATKYTPEEQCWRVLWAILGKPIFRLSPRPFFSWRRLLLRCFGAKVGKEVHVYPSTTVYFPWNLEIGDWSAVGEDALIYNLGKVTIGERVTISHWAHLCAGTHDYTKPDFPLLKPPIVVKNQAWICSQAFVGPGVTIGEGAIVGAGAVVMKDVDAWPIVAGNPAVKVKVRPKPGSHI
ncbi:MAG: WcaF family extracellular polysaccharide biosynthesis acetyltransferase [Verrucomicrobiae bacterium]|nr:WcaF family extracellular polysaccharide biosynthesis acetyltransferase [Verrucomicrobiae bacterium]